MRSYIQLYTGEQLHLSEEIQMAITYSIADIRDPDKRDASFSKTISIPASKASDSFFKAAFEIDNYDNYNTNKKAGAIIFTDGLTQLDGYLQLLNINITDSHKIVYEVCIKGNGSSLFQVVGDLFLNELDYSDLDHTLTKVNQKASWLKPVGTGYVYPLINYGTTNKLFFNVTDLFVSVYVKEYLDRIFKYAGYTYESEFLNSEYFKRLIMPYNGRELKLSGADLAARYFNVSFLSNTINLSGVVTSPTPVFQVIKLNKIVSDVYSQFNTTTHEFTNLNNGTYRFYYSLTGYVEAGGVFTMSNKIFYVRIFKKDLLGVDTAIGLFELDYGTTNTTKTFQYTTPDVYLKQGEKVYSVVIDAAPNSFPSFDWDLIFTPDSYFYDSYLNISLNEGNMVRVDKAVPDIKAKDFLLSIFKMFNLYAQLDNNKTDNLLIEPRNDFYDNGKIVDWTSKLGIDQDVVITPIGELNAIKYKYSYKEDKDTYNSRYNDSYKESYGTHEEIIDNDFIKETSTTELIFSPTPLVEVGNTGVVLSNITPTAPNVVSGVNVVSKSNPRILYYGGLQTANYPWSYYDNAGVTIESEIPFAGHIDNLNNPSIDLCFGVPKEVYFNTTRYTTNNLFKTFHKEFLDEISNPNSKVVTSYFHLSPVDIATLDFRNTFLVVKYHLRLNKIYDHNPLSNSLTKCEFIKIEKTNSYTPLIEEDLIDSPQHIRLSDNKNIKSDSNIISETSEGCIVTGTGNYVGDRCLNITLTGCKNCNVANGLENVTLINCNNISIYESNVCYMVNTLIT